jgi:hypothetical protein
MVRGYTDAIPAFEERRPTLSGGIGDCGDPLE